MTNQLHMVFGAMDAVFRALADATRRRLLDALIRSDGQSLTQLEQGIEMSRHGVMKHLRILESAGLVTCHRHGRRKLHYLNPVPIAALGEAWMGRFAPPMSASTFAWDRAGGKKAPVNGAPVHAFVSDFHSCLTRAVVDGDHRPPVHEQVFFCGEGRIFLRSRSAPTLPTVERRAEGGWRGARV